MEIESTHKLMETTITGYTVQLFLIHYQQLSLYAFQQLENGLCHPTHCCDFCEQISTCGCKMIGQLNYYSSHRSHRSQCSGQYCVSVEISDPFRNDLQAEKHFTWQILRSPPLPAPNLCFSRICTFSWLKILIQWFSQRISELLQDRREQGIFTGLRRNL